MDNSLPKLPTELWQMIFSLLPLNDQVDCRKICKEWYDLIVSLPEFKRKKSCLNLEYCTLSEEEHPVSTIMSSNLEIRTLNIGDEVDLKIFPTLIEFIGKLGETVTHLDISKVAGTDVYRIVLDHLSLFKVLHNLNIGQLNHWITAVTTTAPNGDKLELFLKWLFDDYYHPYDLEASLMEFGHITQEEIEGYLKSSDTNDSYACDSDGDDFNNSYDSILIKRDIKIIVQAITKYFSESSVFFDYASYTLKEEDLLFSDLVELVYSAIIEANQSLSFENRVNPNVRIISFFYESSKAKDVKDLEKLFTLMPNVEELNVDSHRISDDLLEIFKRYKEKITSVQINKEEELDKIVDADLAKLRHLKIKNSYSEFSEEIVDTCVDLFPIEEISLDAYELPCSNFELITELRLDQNCPDTLQLQDLQLFKNLHYFILFINSHYEEVCTTDHQIVNLESIRKLDFTIYSGEYCSECFKTLLKSLPNLREMNYKTYGEKLEFDPVFKFQSNLERLTCVGWRVRTDMGLQNNNIFNPNKEWPEMKKLKVLKLENITIDGEKDAWNDFGKKLSQLKFLEVQANLEVDMLDLIGTNMSALHKVRILNLRKMVHKPSTKTICRNGRKLLVDEYRY